MKYIATRERVEKLEGSGPVTNNQESLIKDLLRDFPDAKELDEYKHYSEAPTSSSASALISAALDANAHEVAGRDGYMKYIATRPRVERHGEHGLFSSRPVSLNDSLKEIENHTGNVWTFIWSLRRGDAARLGYDHAESWRKLLMAYQVEIAEAMKIPPDQLRWRAAFHDEGGHPHIHAMIWSADGCIAPKVQKFERKTLRPEDMKGYLDAANARGLLPMFYLALVSGLRKGELVALLWSDLDIENRTIFVSKQYVRNPNGELTLSRPKTETSVRRVSIPQEAVDLLIQEHNKHPDNQYMFPSPATEEMYHPDSVAKLHEKILKDADLEHIPLHGLRHTFATVALQNGVDVKTVSSMLGHYDAGFTLRTYTHATRQVQNQAAETMGNFMAQVM